jgi:PAS domain S-box-containing protein
LTAGDDQAAAASGTATRLEDGMRSEPSRPRRTRQTPARDARDPTNPPPAIGTPGSAEPGQGELRFRALVELAPDAIVVTDPTGRITLTNQQTAALFGYAQAELLGQPVEKLLPERYHDIHRQHRASYMAAPRTRPMGTRLELWGRRRDGHEFPVEVSLSPLPSPAPEREATDQFAVMSIIRDVSERLELVQARAAAEAARRESQRLGTVIDAMTDAVGVYDAEGRLVQANGALRRLFALDGDPRYAALPPTSAPPASRRAIPTAVHWGPARTGWDASCRARCSPAMTHWSWW